MDVVFIFVYLTLILYAIHRLAHKLYKKIKPHIELELNINKLKIKGKITMVTLTATQFVEGTLNVVDRLGNPSQVEAGTVVITSSDETVCLVNRIDANELAFIIESVGPGVAQINYSADADLGEGIETIAGFTGVEVTPAHAVGFGITFGEPQERV